ncbi:MAG: sulfur carrier protein ThiS [Actinobacteria bacterium]|nr:MAG: sulfur carrier protein ThiS [Actinomycetota bacterium]
MKVHVNGDPRATCATTVADLLAELGVDPARVAVELERTIVAREAFETTPLAEDARVEVVRFVNGG